MSETNNTTNIPPPLSSDPSMERISSSVMGGIVPSLVEDMTKESPETTLMLRAMLDLMLGMMWMDPRDQMKAIRFLNHICDRFIDAWNARVDAGELPESKRLTLEDTNG